MSFNGGGICAPPCAGVGPLTGSDTLTISGNIFGGAGSVAGSYTGVLVLTGNVE